MSVTLDDTEWPLFTLLHHTHAFAEPTTTRGIGKLHNAADVRHVNFPKFGGKGCPYGGGH